MSSQDSDSELSALIQELIAELKQELRQSQQEVRRNRRRGFLVDNDCECQDRRGVRIDRMTRSVCSGPKPKVCKDNPKRCQCVDGQWVELEVNPVVNLSKQIIDQGIAFTRSSSYEAAEKYVESSVNDLCGTAAPNFPFPSPLPRGFTPTDLTPLDFYHAAVEFEYAADAIVTGDDDNSIKLQKLFYDQAARLKDKFIRRDAVKKR